MVASGPTYTVRNNLNVNMGTSNLAQGTYRIIPGGLILQDALPNYSIVYKEGTLTVGAPLTANYTAPPVLCYSDSVAVVLTAHGGTAPYSYTNPNGCLYQYHRFFHAGSRYSSIQHN